MVDQGIKVKTPRPNLGALTSVISAATRLSGERSDPMMPIRFGAAMDYATRVGLSPRFADLILAYDSYLRDELQKTTEGPEPDGPGRK